MPITIMKHSVRNMFIDEKLICSIRLLEMVSASPSGIINFSALKQEIYQWIQQ